MQEAAAGEKKEKKELSQKLTVAEQQKPIELKA